MAAAARARVKAWGHAARGSRLDDGHGYESAHPGGGAALDARSAATGGPELRALAARLRDDISHALGDIYDPRAALDAVWALVDRANRHVEASRPWALAREAGAGHADASRRLDTVLYELAEVCRLIAEGLRPLLPDTAGRIASTLGLPLATSWTRGFEWGGLRPGQPIGRPVRLFPRPDLAAHDPGPAVETSPSASGEPDPR